MAGGTPAIVIPEIGVGLSPSCSTKRPFRFRPAPANAFGSPNLRNCPGREGIPSPPAGGFDDFNLDIPGRGIAREF